MFLPFLTVYRVLQSDCWELPEGQRGDSKPFCVSSSLFLYIYINAIIICKLTILYWFTSIYESYYSYRVHWRIVQGQKDLKLIIERLWASLSAVLPTKPTLFCLLSVRRFSIQPVCGDLQSQILKCYKENTGKTLSCSSIASAYMQCVDNAKKVPLNI